jgi:hypothetical protein
MPTVSIMNVAWKFRKKMSLGIPFISWRALEKKR